MRPGHAQALAALRSGDTLVVPKLDRLARPVPDARDIGDTLAARGPVLVPGTPNAPTQVVDVSDVLAWLFDAVQMGTKRERPKSRVVRRAPRPCGPHAVPGRCRGLGTLAGAHDGGLDEGVSMEYDCIRFTRDADVTTITMDRPKRRNALSLLHMQELTDAFARVGASDARGVVLAANGPVFCAGHDFADVAGSDLEQVRHLLWTCTELMTLMQRIPQPVVARVHGLATAAGCQLVAAADLAVAADTAGFAAPGGKGGWFCHTPMVAIARTVGRKRAVELALSGDVIDASTAREWGLVNQVVPAEELDGAVAALVARVTRGSAQSKGIGKQALYAQLDLAQPQAYAYAVEVMAATSQTPDAAEAMAAFLEKRAPVWNGG